MKPVRFNEEKNVWLRKKRGIDFNQIGKVIKRNGFVKIIKHPNKKKYPKQRMFLVNFKNYIIVIPFIEETDYIFLKTLYPSHKYTKKYLKVNKQ